ncbi:hypothetical protein [Algibacter sp. L3A6]|uniref:hypothetical protein n=1 Tax=Algibacter sp. L3A6 TaxID=2686366 RepID=UPI0018EEE889|nr:hypothetical protein [Algibacter sp. L3A6]
MLGASVASCFFSVVGAEVSVVAVSGVPSANSSSLSSNKEIIRAVLSSTLSALINWAVVYS